MSTDAANTYTVHTKDTAPDASKPVLEQVEQAFGFIPNVIGVLAESPLAVSAYATINGLAEEKSRFTPQEQQVAILAISKENGCDYCVSAHAKVAGMKEVPADVVQALQEGRDPDDAKLAALSRTARLLVEKRGWIDEAAQNAFFEAGYKKAHLLDLIALAALKTISNYSNHIAQTELDREFS